MARGREVFKKYKKAIVFVGKCLNILPQKVQYKLFIKTRKITGGGGMVIRYILIKNLARSVGDNVSIHPDVYMFNIQNLSIGDNVSIHPMCYIEAYGGIEIGNDVSIAHGVTIMSVTHRYSDIDVPIKDQGIVGKPITISDNVWIGAKASILGDVVINSGVIIGAGAVVNKDVEKNTICLLYTSPSPRD